MSDERCTETVLKFNRAIEVDMVNAGVRQGIMYIDSPFLFPSFLPFHMR